MKIFLGFLSIFALIFIAKSLATIERIDVVVHDPKKGNCVAKINVGPNRKTVDIDVETFIEAKDLDLKFGAFSFIDGKYNEFIESDTVSVCDMPKSDHPLVSFMYKEMLNHGNLLQACPVKKGVYFLHNFGIEESDMPVALPPGSFKIEVNGSLQENGQEMPLYTFNIFFKEA